MGSGFELLAPYLQTACSTGLAVDSDRGLPAMRKGTLRPERQAETAEDRKNMYFGTGVPEAQGIDSSASDDSTGGGADHFIDAAGRICQNCDGPIRTGQPARRKGADGWVHDVCPPVLD